VKYVITIYPSVPLVKTDIQSTKMDSSGWTVCYMLNKEIIKNIKERNEFLPQSIIDGIGGFRVMMMEV